MTLALSLNLGIFRTVYDDAREYVLKTKHLPRTSIALSLLGIAFVCRLNTTLAVELNITTATLVPEGELEIPNSSMIVLAKAIPFLKFALPTLAELSKTNTRSRPSAPEDKPDRAKLSLVLQLSLSIKCRRRLSATLWSPLKGSTTNHSSLISCGLIKGLF